MIKYADLHIHTHYSDGTQSPKEVVDDAIAAGLNCIAITDHDTLEGVKPAQLAAQDTELEVISGIELSSESGNKDIHVLGYLIDPEQSVLKERITVIQQTRVERIQQMIEKLNELGVDNITLEEVCALTKSKSVGRPHLAAKLLEKRWVGSIREAFEKYIGEGCPAYVAKFKQSPDEAIKLIDDCGGIAVLAHPMITQQDEKIPAFVEAGLKGLEVYYPNCPPSVQEYYKGIAQKHNLLLTGGSDAHGKAKNNTWIGKARIPYELVEHLREARK